MPKPGQARVLTPAQQAELFRVIQDHRHPEKNTAIMQISFKLGLRVQEIALLQLKEVCRLGPRTSTAPRAYILLEVMALPASYTKGADAMKRSASKYQRNRLAFTVHEFAKMLRQVETLIKNGEPINPEDHYPELKKHEGNSRDLPMVDADLRTALDEHLAVRLQRDPVVKPSDPLFITQKGAPYSPNTLQEHMALMLRDWLGVEKANSHSGRRSLITDIIHEQGKPVKVAQKIAAHVSPATTIIYEDATEKEIAGALKDLTKKKIP